MAGAFQPNVSLNQAIFNACDALCVLAGTERPVLGVDPIWQIEKKGAAAIVALGAAGIPSDVAVAAIAARVTNLETVEYFVAAANAALPNAKVLASSPTIQFSTVGSSVQIRATGDALKFNILSAGTNMASTQATVLFSNENGVSFGMNTNNVITASHNGITSQSNQAVSADNGSFAFQTLSFSNLNGVTFGTSAGSAIWASHNGLTSQSNQAFSANGGMSTFQTLGFSDGGGVTFTNTNGSVGATVRTDYASSNHSHGNPSLALTNLSGTTASNSNGLTLSLSAANPVTTAGLISAINVSAGATSNNLSALTFSNGSGVTFGLTGSVITASVETNYQSTGAYLTTAMQSQSSSVFARTGFTSTTTAGTALVGTLNTDGLSVGVPNWLTTAMASNRGSDFVQATAAFAGTNASGTIASNGISVSVAAGSNSSMSISDAATSGTIARLAFTNLNGVTLSLSTGAGGSHTIVGSHNGLTSQSNQAFSAAGGASAFQTLNFADSFGVSFSNSNGSVVGSIATTYAGTGFTSGGANIGLSGTLNSNGLSLSATVAAGSNSSWTVSDGATSATVGRLAFSNSNGLAFGLSTSNNGQHTITGSYTVPTVTNSSWTVSDANTSGSVARLAFTNLNGVTLSLSSGAAGLHTIVGSHNGLTSQSNQAFSASGGASAFQTLVFTNGSGVTFSNSGGSLAATVQTDYASSNHSHGNPTLFLTNLSGTTASASNGLTLSLSAAAAAGTSWTVSDANTSATVGRLAFTQSNGLTLSLSTSNNGNHTVIGSYTVPTITSWTVSDANTSATVGRLAFTQGNGLTLSLSTSNNGNHTVIGSYTVPTVTNSSMTVSDAATSGTLARLAFTNLNGVTLSLSSGAAGLHTIVGSHNGLTTARASNDAIGLNTAQTNVTWTVNSSGLSLNAAGYAGTTTGFTGANLSASMTHNSLGLAISMSAGAPGGAATYSNFFQPFDLYGNSQTATSNASLSQLHLMPFTLPVNLSYGNINYIASVPVLNTGVVGTWSIRLTSSSSLAFEAYFTIGNTNFIDCFLFSRGTGGYSSELQTFASTRNSFITHQSVTFGGTANRTAGSTGSMSARQSHSMLISYPMMTSGTITSVNPASTFVTWGMGYTTWNSTASTSVSNTYNTTTTGSTSIASTMAGTTAWSSYKMVPMMCATGSLSPGEYWLGQVRYSSTSSASASSQTNAAAGTGASYTTTFGASALTRTQDISWLGQTTSIASSLGWLGFASQASMAEMPGHGSFSGTWASNTTYLNNAANPAGAVAFSQMRTNVSFFRTWFQMANNRI